MSEFTRKNKFMASTAFTNLGSTSNRLPQLNRSFSGSTGKSTKLKLTTIDATLSTISQELHDLRLETRVNLLSFSNHEDLETS
jgi:hypothetical protein